MGTPSMSLWAPVVLICLALLAFGFSPPNAAGAGRPLVAEAEATLECEPPSATPTRAPSATPTRAPSATPTRAPSATPPPAPSATPPPAPSATGTPPPAPSVTSTPAGAPTIGTPSPAIEPTTEERTPVSAPTADTPTSVHYAPPAARAWVSVSCPAPPAEGESPRLFAQFRAEAVTGYITRWQLYDAGSGRLLEEATFPIGAAVRLPSDRLLGHGEPEAYLFRVHASRAPGESGERAVAGATVWAGAPEAQAALERCAPVSAPTDQAPAIVAPIVVASPAPQPQPATLPDTGGPGAASLLAIIALASVALGVTLRASAARRSPRP